MKFSDLKLKDQTIKGLDKMGFVNPTEIQYKAIPAGLAGKDILGQAQTGTGKTAAFGICILEKTDWENHKGLQHLVLAPTRELANQIAAEITQLGRFYNLRIGVIIGGEGYHIQERMMANKPHIIVSTPGRLIDYIEKGKITFQDLKTFTLDEVDEMLNVGFYPEVMRIVAKIPKECNKYMFTATTDKRTDQIASQLLVNPEVIKVSTGHESKKNINQMALVVKETEKFNALVNQIMHHEGKQAIIFCRTKERVRRLTLQLRQLGIRAEMIQGDMSQGARTRSMSGFREKRDQVLIATDVAARGIDIPGIEYVYNYDLPENDEYYTHRIGRTGRAGMEGHSYSFVRPDQLDDLHRLTKMTKSTIKTVEAIAGETGHKEKLVVQNVKRRIGQLADSVKVTDEQIQEILGSASPEQLVKALVALAGRGPEERVRDDSGSSRSGGFKRRFDDRSGSSGGGFKRRFGENRSYGENRERKPYEGGERKPYEGGARKSYEGGARKPYEGGERKPYSPRPYSGARTGTGAGGSSRPSRFGSKNDRPNKDSKDRNFNPGQSSEF